MVSLNSIFPDDPAHPSQIALRTYALAASLSLTPAVVTLLSNRSWVAFRRILARELSPTGFPFTATLAVAGTFYLKRLWIRISAEYPSLSSHLPKWITQAPDSYKTFISACIASTFSHSLLQAGSRRFKQTSSSILFTPPIFDTKPSSTIDLTLLLFVRAIDALVQSFVIHRADSSSAIQLSEAPSDPNFTHIHHKLSQEKARRMTLHRKNITARIDAIVFWLSCTKIMLSWCYTPNRLPRSYVKWISALARVDERLLNVLRLIRTKGWTYTRPTAHRDILHSYSQGLGYPPEWGDPTLVPAFGGKSATDIWKSLGVTNRTGVGGIPCELVHAGVGKSMGLQSSCTANAGLRGITAFMQAMAIYVPVHFLPVILTDPKSLLRLENIAALAAGASRSATFLSAFIATFYYAVCFTRTLVLARIFPFISHDFWDSPNGCIFAGSLLCGTTILIENGSRRGEMALYVLPRAIRAFLSERWLHHRSFHALERTTFVLALSTLLTIVSHKPESLRGLSRWVLTFFLNGPKAGFWRHRRLESKAPNGKPKDTPSPTTK